jgi:hypothetical protein
VTTALRGSGRRFLLERLKHEDASLTGHSTDNSNEPQFPKHMPGTICLSYRIYCFSDSKNQMSSCVSRDVSRLVPRGVIPLSSFAWQEVLKRQRPERVTQPRGFCMSPQPILTLQQSTLIKSGAFPVSVIEPAPGAQDCVPRGPGAGHVQCSFVLSWASSATRICRLRASHMGRHVERPVKHG